ncbi:MAG: hypothetical protein ACUVWR_11530 [Anaerolineae bacterium]
MTQDKSSHSLGAEFQLQESEIMIATSEFRQRAFAFITEGSLAYRDLCQYNDSEPIPDRESAITALTYHEGMNKVYGATSGSRSHLFYYDPSPAAEHVVDIGLLADSPSDCRALHVLDDGSLVGVVNPAGMVFRYRPRGEYSLLWTKHTNEIECLGQACAGRPVAATVTLPGRNALYGVSKGSSELFEFDLHSGRSRELAAIAGADKGNALAWDREGNIYGSSQDSTMFCYSTTYDQVRYSASPIPSPRGMEFLNQLDSCSSCEDGFIYCGSTLGTIFALRTADLSLRPYGRPGGDHRIRAITRGRNGLIYGCAGCPGMVSHLFALDPGSGQVKDLGVPMVHFPLNWVCYEIGALAVGRNGEVYIGEADRISHLFIYYPPATSPCVW